MKKINLLLNAYGESHRNKVIHRVCVPLILFSILCLLWSIPSGWLSAPFSKIPAAFANWTNLLLSPPLFSGMLLFSVLYLLGGWQLDAYLADPLCLLGLVIFVVAWAGPFYGHKVEGKKPNFIQHIHFLLVGRAWLPDFIFQKPGLR